MFGVQKKYYKNFIYFWIPDFDNYWPLCLAEFLHACEPFSEVTVWSEAVVIWGQLEQFDLSDDLKFLQAHGQRDKVKKKNLIFQQN